MENKQIAKAFIEAQKEMGSAVKDSKNPFFKSTYADLNSVREACIPALNKNGIAILQPIVQIDGKNFVKTVLLHESGETMEGLTEIVFAKQNDAQAQGSGITYARRYGLQSLVCIGAEDDDGNAASKQAKKPNLAKAADEDMQEIFANQADENFALIKQELENCDSLESLGITWKKWSKELNSFKKWDKDKYDLLEEAKNFLKEELEPDLEDDGLPI